MVIIGRAIATSIHKKMVTLYRDLFLVALDEAAISDLRIALRQG